MFKGNLQTGVEYEVLTLQDFRHGLNSYVAADRIALTEASDLVNWMIRKGGSLVSRPPVVKYSNSATTSNAAVVYIEEANIGGTMYTLLVDSNHKLYYLDGGLDPTLIGTLEGATTIMSYNGAALLFDGSYVKYLDGVTSIKIAYDGGTGTTGYQFDYSSSTDDTHLALGNGTNIGVAQKFTTQAWDSGYTIPVTTVTAYLSENGSANASAVTCKIRSFANPATILASKVMVADASGIGGTATEYSAVFTSSDITTEMSPSTAYFVTLEHTGGDAANYVKVHCNNIGSGGLSYSGVTDLGVIGNWSADTAKNCLMSVAPGRPPKGKFGTIWNRRPWIGGDSSNPGYVWYGNLTQFDWSTTDGGGYISLVDDDSNNFEVGGMTAFYGNLYVFGTQEQPYLVKISGESPSAYAQEMTFQRPWATHRTLTSSVNDIWYSTDEGSSPISGVQEYGDLRTFFASDPITDRFEDYWSSSTAIASYYPEDGQLWLVMPTYHRVLVCHTKNAVQGPSGAGVRYPWAEYELYHADLSNADNGRWNASGSGTNEYYYTDEDGNDPGFDAQPDFITMDRAVLSEGTAGSLTDHQWDYGDNDTLGFNTVYIRDESGDPDTTGVCIRSVLIPQSFGKTGGTFLIGGSDGYIYKVDPSDYKDQSTIQMKPVIYTAYVEMPFGEVNFNEMHLLVSTTGGGSITTNFYTNGQYATATASETIALAIKDDLTVDELTMDVEDALFLVDPASAVPLYKYVNFNGRSVMVAVDSITMAGYPIYNNGILLKYRRLSY